MNNKIKAVLAVALLTLSSLAAADFTPRTPFDPIPGAPQMPTPQPVVHCYPMPSGGVVCH